jgi:hypothetical protein
MAAFEDQSKLRHPARLMVTSAWEESKIGCSNVPSPLHHLLTLGFACDTVMVKKKTSKTTSADSDEI